MESSLYDYKKGGEIQTIYGNQEGERQIVLFKPAFGLLNQPKYISLKYSPLTIELDFDSDETANIVTPDAAAI